MIKIRNRKQENFLKIYSIYKKIEFEKWYKTGKPILPITSYAYLKGMIDTAFVLKIITVYEYNMLMSEIKDMAL